MADLINDGLQEALKMENTSVEKLNSMLTISTDLKMKEKLQQHLAETNTHIRKITQRLEMLGLSPTTEKANAPPITLKDGNVDIVAKLTNDVENELAWENFEIAHYEFLKQRADNLRDKDTKKVAEDNQKDEKRFAGEIEGLIRNLVNKEAGPSAL